MTADDLKGKMDWQAEHDRVFADERHGNRAEVEFWLNQHKLFTRRLLAAIAADRTALSEQVDEARAENTVLSAELARVSAALTTAEHDKDDLLAAAPAKEKP